MNRMRTAPKDLRQKRHLAWELKTYAMKKNQLQIDPIDASHVIGPVFGIPALDLGMNMHDIGSLNSGGTGKNSKNHSLYYVLRPDLVECNFVATYDDYLKKNDHLFTKLPYKRKADGKKSTKKGECVVLNYGAYLSVKEMKEIKIILNTGESIEEWEDHRHDDSENSDTDDEF